MAYFDFLGLPSVVRDKIADEVVHNAPPEDRIQLALACKSINESVKRARPKKILQNFSFNDVALIRDNMQTPRIKRMVDKLRQVHVDTLRYDTVSLTPPINRGEFLQVLGDAAHFATSLSIMSATPAMKVDDEVIAFYQRFTNLENLQCSIELPFYAPHINVPVVSNITAALLHDIGKKSKTIPLESLKWFPRVPAAEIQKFLLTAKFAAEAKLLFFVQQNRVPQLLMKNTPEPNVFETRIIFENEPKISVNQEVHGKKRKLIVSLFDCAQRRYEYRVTSASSPKKPLVIGQFKKGKNEITVKNVDPKDWIRVSLTKDYITMTYADDMLEEYFPRNKYSSVSERCKVIRKTLGCEIIALEARKLESLLPDYHFGMFLNQDTSDEESSDES
uniref:F-box domain-containing protein n=1 Tax=Panagrolaimus sp. JU765 TaxID=591449 RepID=A0AC34QF24_9BILA